MWKFIWFPKLWQDTELYILVIPPKWKYDFKSKLYIKKSDNYILKVCFNFIDYYFTF